MSFRVRVRVRVQTWTYNAIRPAFLTPSSLGRYKCYLRNAHRQQSNMTSKRPSQLSPISTELSAKNKDKPVPTPLRLDSPGVEPSILIGKVLQKTVRSCRHPMITFHFSDSSAYQIHVEGYHPNPTFQGVPKVSTVQSNTRLFAKI